MLTYGVYRMPKIISDDIGSFPLTDGAERDNLQKIALEISTGKASEPGREEFNRAIMNIMQQKIDSGIHRPNYPQVHDMVNQFFVLLENFYEDDAPWVVKKEFARVPEIDALDSVGREYYKKSGMALELRVCVTGPLELYLKKVGTQIEGDLLMNLAKSVSRFIGNSIIDKKYLKTRVICIDEPSLGINPNLVYETEDLIRAWEMTTKNISANKEMDVQAHLHSPADSELIYEVDGINIIGIESAESPEFLDSIEKTELESYDKFLRVGIARTNIFGIAGDFNEKFGVDVWTKKNFSELIETMENSRIIEKRLGTAWKLFGDRIRYSGPDCGLGAWPNQETAFTLLKNTADAINKFNKVER